MKKLSESVESDLCFLELREAFLQFNCFIFIDMRRVIYIYNINQKIEGIHENDFLIISKTA